MPGGEHMPLYLTLSEGPRADQTRPVLATGDRRIIGELLRAIGQLGDSCGDADEEERPPAAVRPIGSKRARELAVQQ